MSSIIANHEPRASITSETKSTKMAYNLSSMPHEVKETIVEWLYLSSQINHLLRRHCQYDIPHDSIGFSSLESDEESTSGVDLYRDTSLISIRSLASVDSTFYELCRPYLFERIEFYDDRSERIRSTLEDIIDRHSVHVRNLWWRSPTERNYRPDLLLEILQACPRLTHLDIEVDTREQKLRPKAGSPWSHHRCLIERFIEPISQMASLTHLCLSSLYVDLPRFSEKFIVSILSNLPHLQSFACSGITSSVSKKSTDHQSPVGLLLASLPHLTQLELREAQCFDATWTRLDWSGSLKELSLKDCNRVSMATLHKFTQLFASTLTRLSLNNVPIYHNEDWCDDRSTDFMRNRIQFDLPKLTILEMSSGLPIPFFKAFQASENISMICLHDTSTLRRVDIEKLVQDKFWPALQTLQVTRRTSYFTPARIQSLREVCNRAGVRFHFDTRIRDNDEAPEFHAFEIAMSMLSRGRSNSPIDEGIDDDDN